MTAGKLAGKHHEERPPALSAAGQKIAAWVHERRDMQGAHGIRNAGKSAEYPVGVHGFGEICRENGFNLFKAPCIFYIHIVIVSDIEFLSRGDHAGKQL
jgi:hypothetical protein